MRNARWAAESISGSNWYPIYLAYCTGLLEKHGHKTKLVDAPIHNLSHRNVLEIAKKFSPELTVIYISDVSFENDVRVGELIKKFTDSYTILVGPWCSIEPKDKLKKAKGIDSIAVGEFDYTILDLAEEKPEEEINGLIYHSGAGVIENPERKPLTEEQINQFPFVTDVYRRHLNINNYFQAPHLHPFIDMFIGRGCPWGLCTFCLWPHTINEGASYRERSIDDAIEELKFIKEEIPQVKEVFIQDDTLSAKRAVELSKAILREDLNITWSCYSRPNLDYETLRLMAASGCRAVHVGYESADQDILNNIRKGVAVSQMEQFTEHANKAGLLIHADFIVGLPGETEKTIKETVKWARNLEVHSYQFTEPYPYPKTPFYKFLEENNYLNEKGEVNYPHLSSKEIREWTKWALRKTNLSPEFTFRIFRLLKEPQEVKRLGKAAKHFLPKVIL